MSDTIPKYLNEEAKAAESRVVGAALLGGMTIDHIGEILSADDFSFHMLRVVMKTAFEMHANGVEVSAAMVLKQMIADGTRDELGHAAGSVLGTLVIEAGSGAECIYYSKIVRNNAILRRLSHMLADAKRTIDDGSLLPEEILVSLDKQLFEISSSDAQLRAGDLIRLDEVVGDILARVDHERPKDLSPIIRSGFEAMDNYIGGFRGGRLYIVAARPGIGKSALALAVALNASNAGYSPLLFSLEMGAEEVGERAIAINSGVALNRIAEPPLDQFEIEAIASSRGVGRLWIDQRADLTAPKLASTARRAVRAKDVRLIILDYLQLLTPENPRDQRHLQVGQDTRRLKQLARQLNVPVICLCQLNRESEQRTDNEPMLSDLRDSGEIEQNADTVVMIWQDKAESIGEEITIKCKVAKQRNGPKGKFELTYRRPCVRFENRRTW